MLTGFDTINRNFIHHHYQRKYCKFRHLRDDFYRTLPVIKTTSFLLIVT